jgi:subtilisin family serine protease
MTNSGFDDPLTDLQWDMFQIQVPEAHSVNMGDPSVIVGDIDTGIDAYHPDLAQNVDWSRSVSCIGGVPDQDYAAWEDNHFHGTHTAGTIAAAANGIGIVGVAPEVKIAAIKGCNDSGYCWPEAIVCSFMWAAEHDIDVTNNSYYVDPYEFNCHNDPEQHAIWKAVQRAVRYAQSKGVTVVSSSGNSNVDLTHLPGEYTNACNDLPVELAGVVVVSANGNLMQKSYYSSYGVGVVDVVAPGGDARFQLTAEAPNGRVLSTIPTKFGVDYGWAQGTSMASPHVAGVAALIISQYGEMPPGKVQAFINQTADPQECPAEFNPGPPFFWSAECQGGEGYNSFYGHGQVNAYNAVTHDTGK